MKRVLNFYRKDDCKKHYTIGRTLGTGSFAVVRHGISKTDGTEWAIKCIDKSQLERQDEEALQTEVEILKQLDHPNIVKMKEIFDCPKTFYMVLEMMTGGELFDRIVQKEKYTEEEARRLVAKLLHALAFCHSRGIVHRDLKPENLLYSDETDDAEIKIADFGLAKLMSSETLLETACGTPGYVAPEILEGQPYQEAVDMWSIGVITYILLCGFPPFFDENNAALFRQIKAGAYDYPSPYWDGVSDEAKNFIDTLLVVDPSQRATAEVALQHIWLAGEADYSNELNSAVDELRKFNARKRLKAEILAARAVSAFQSMGVERRLREAVRKQREAQAKDENAEDEDKKED